MTTTTAIKANKNTKKAIAMFVASLSPAELTAQITAICERSTMLQADIQTLSINIMLHIYTHGDISPAQALVDGLGKGIRAKALVEWFNRCGLDVSEKDEKFVGFKRVVMEKRFDEMKALNWFELKPENPFAGFNLQEEIERLIKRAEKAMSKGNELVQAGDKDAADLVKVDTNMMMALKALKVNAPTTVTVQ